MIRYPGAGLRRSSNSSTPSASASWLSSCDAGLYCPCSSAAIVASSMPARLASSACVIPAFARASATVAPSLARDTSILFPFSLVRVDNR